VITEASTSKQCALELEALPSRIQQVRRIVAAQLRYWHLEPLTDQALLGITELLANVHRHAEPDKRCSVELTFASGWLTVAVSDSDPRLPRVRDFEPMGTCGRGLAIVVALSDSWGTEALHGGGKVVWFTLRAETPVPYDAVTEPLYVSVGQTLRRPEVTLV
jgi:anti-sigma regulatory factor (Ser/Thr protein kinase)